MSLKLSFLTSLYVLLIFILLQALTFLVPANILIFNNKFILGIFEANNAAILFLVIFSYFPSTILLRSNDKKLRFGSMILLSAILSNLVDRIFRGGATDYISIFNFPTFNLADILIIIGIIIIGFNYLFERK
jgi:signal peptidase II